LVLTGSEQAHPIGINIGGWIKGKVVLRRVYYVYEDEFSEGIFLPKLM